MGLFNRKSTGNAKAKEVVREAQKPIREGLEIVDVYSGVIKYDKSMGFIAQYMALEGTCHDVLNKRQRDLKVMLARLAADAETYRFNVFKALNEFAPSESDKKTALDIGLAKRKVPPRVLTAEKALEEARKGLKVVHAHKEIFYVMDFSTLLIEYNMLMNRCNEVITGRPTVLNAEVLLKEAYKYQKDVDAAVACAKERVAKVPMDKDPKLAGDSKYIPFDPETPKEWQETSEMLVSKSAEIANKGKVLFENNAQLLAEALPPLVERYNKLGERANNIMTLKEKATEGGKRLVGDAVCFVAAVQKAIADKTQENLEREGKIKKIVPPDIEASTGVPELDYALYILHRTEVRLGEEWDGVQFRRRIDELKEKKEAKEVKALLIEVVLAASKALRAKITGTATPKATENGNGNGHAAPAPESSTPAPENTNGIQEVSKDDKGKAKEGAAVSSPTTSTTRETRPPLVVLKDREDNAALLYCDALNLLCQFNKIAKEDVEKLDKQAAGLENKIAQSIDDKTFAKETRVFKDLVLVAIDKPRKERIQELIDAEIQRQASKIPVFQVHIPDQQKQAPPQATQDQAQVTQAPSSPAATGPAAVSAAA